MKKFLTSLLFLLAFPAWGQIPGGAEIQIDRTPVIGGTASQCLYITTGKKVGSQACSAIADNIQVGVTTVGGGTTTRILYDNAGVLGETLATTNAAGALIVPAGSATLPSFTFASDTDTGIYQDGANTIGFASTAKKLGSWVYRVDAGGNDNSWLQLGSGQLIPNTGIDSYVSTIGVTTANTTGAGAIYVGINIGSAVLRATDTVTKTGEQAMVELDKLDLYGDGGAVIFSKAGGLRVRAPLPHTGVTISESYSIQTIPPAGGEGTTTVYKAIKMRGGSNATAGTVYGFFLEEAPSGGAIATHDGQALTLVASADGSSGGLINLNAKNSGGIISLQSNSIKMLEIGTTSGAYWTMNAGSTPAMIAKPSGGGSGNAGAIISANGTSPVSLSTGGNTVEGLRVSHTASGVNYVNITPGTTGNAATIGSQGETNTPLIVRTAGTGALDLSPGGSSKFNYGTSHGSAWSFLAPVYIEASNAFFSGKATDPGSAAGAGYCKTYWVAGTAGGSGKLVAYCGTSTTPVTIVDNVGTGF